MVEHTVNYKTARFLIKETVLYRGAIYTHIEWIPAILYYFKIKHIKSIDNIKADTLNRKAEL